MVTNFFTMHFVIHQYYRIFQQSIVDYHVTDNTDAVINNPFDEYSIEHMLYQKNWIDTVQWHLEDRIRHPDIDAQEALIIKRTIDRYNQQRTDMVETLDDCIVKNLGIDEANTSLPLNTESIGWALDRLSILALKIYHTEEAYARHDISEKLKQCNRKITLHRIR